MSAEPSVTQLFHELEGRLDREPEGSPVEIVHGVYLMSPRPLPRHGRIQGRLFGCLDALFGSPHGSDPPDWLFVIEPDVRSERAFSRVAPDVASWKRSARGWPDLYVTPVTKVPSWVAEVLSPSTESRDRGEKADVYWLMGVGTLWLVDPRAETVEVFQNVRGEMVADGVYQKGDFLVGEPFGATAIPVTPLFT